MPDRPRRGVLGRALVLLAALGLSLVVAEVALRIFLPIPWHDFLEFVPDGRIRGRGRPGQVLVNGSGHEVRINDLGFRGPTPTWEPAPGTLRILALGGSSTFNFHAPGEETTWPARLEARLEERLGREVEVVNLALPGFSSAESKVNFLFLGRALSPHAIVVYHTWNDVKSFRKVDAGEPPIFRPTKRRRGPLRRLARETQIGRRLALLRSSHGLYVENRETSLEEVGTTASLPPGEASWLWFEESFTDIARFAVSAGALPVFVSQATTVKAENLGDSELAEGFGEDLVGMEADVLAATLERASEAIARVARDEGALFVDGFHSVPADGEHLVDHVHLTARGYDRLAETIATTLAADERFLALARSLDAADPAR